MDLIDKIPSFSRDHDYIEPGLYLQELKQGVAILDLRFVKPNTRFIPIEAIHTIEHLFASWLKLSKTCSIKEDVISFNPGGCQTMFYLEVFTSRFTSSAYLIEEVTNNLVHCITWCLEQTEVPGATKEECGNYKSHNLDLAKEWLKEYLNVL